MVYSDLFRAVVILTCISHIHCQYYDIFQAFQPFVQPEPSQPLNFLSDFTTRKPKPKQKVVNNVRHEDVRRLDRIPITDSINDNVRKTVETNKQTTKRKPTNAFDFNFFTSTQRTTRKTTKAPQRKNQNKQETQLSSIVFFEDTKFDRPITSIREIDNKPKSRPTNRKPQETNYETSWFDGRNTVNYYTTRPPQTTKVYNYQQSNKKNNNYYTTNNPLLNRPGVRPAVVNGPPITNRPVTQRPVTQRPGFDQKQGINIDDDLNVSPEVISGPDEDYMSAVEKKRYVDLAERMCDKYKSLTTKQVEAIPLLPSPQPVRVNVSSCPPTNIPLVVGGKVVSVKEFPHMTLLGWRKKNRGYSWKCGGTLLSNQFILTAAHCAYQDRDDNVIIGPPRIVQLGSSYLNDPQAVYMKVASVTKHPKYKIPKAYYDLAIVKMAGTVTFSDMIKPACLGTPPPPNSPIIATGWGRTEFGGSLSEELRSVSIPVWDLSECHNALGVSVKIPYGPSSDSQICAGEKRGGKDTCQGDSGGPAQIQDGCIWRVVAVTSVGRYCGAADTPAIYAIVQRAFISAVVFGKDAQIDNNNRGQATNTNDWNNKRQQTNTNQQNNQGTNTNNDWNNKRQQSSNTNQQNNQATNTNSDWNNKRQQSSTTNQQNNNYNRPSGNNNWNVKPSDTGTDSYGNNRETYNWNNSNQGGGAYPTNSQPNRNEYNNNNYNYNLQTTENYSNSRRDEYYNPSPSRETEVAEGQYYNNYAGSNNFNNNRQQDYVSDGRGDNYNKNNNGGNVWWT